MAVTKSTYYRILFGVYFILLLALPQMVMATPSQLSQQEITRGVLLFNDANGNVDDMPLVSTDVVATVTGPIARTHVTQTFSNNSDNWVEALYLFPLPEDSSVDQLRMLVGDRVIEGQIIEREQAKKTYEKAKQEGKRAALVEQDRPNIFSTAVANIPPHGTIKVEIEFQQSLAWRDGKFTWRFPMAITPRYLKDNYAAEKELSSEVTLSKGWSVLPEEKPNQIDLEQDEQALAPVNLKVKLKPGFDIAQINSLYHRVRQSHSEQNGLEIDLIDANAAANRDFVLSWRPIASQMPRAALFTEQRDDARYALLMINPPKASTASSIAREVTFVIDTSGSMSGQSIRAAKQALLDGLNGLNEQDAFNIVEFNNKASRLFNSPRDVSDASLNLAKYFVSLLKADGGTEMLPALKMALDGSADDGRLKQVVFITDGSVSNEVEILKFINRNLNSHRLFTVAIGSAPNSNFMLEAAVMGRGTHTYIASASEAKQAMSQLFDKLSRPALTNIHVAGEGIEAVTPNPIPDLYSDEPLVVAMKLSSTAKTVELSGQMANTVWKQKVHIQDLDSDSGIAVDWARKQITDLQRSLIHQEAEKEQIKWAVTKLALNFHLVSPYTSLVAVDVTPARPDKDGLEQKAMPSTKPAGLTINFAQTATAYQFLLLLGLMFLVAAGLVFLKLQPAVQVPALRATR
jgi:Ca-activated chloride channel family protein